MEIETKIIDNFLPPNDFKLLRDCIFSKDFSWFYQSIVAYKEVGVYWDWYHTHNLYDKDNSNSSMYRDLYNMIIPKIEEVSEYHSLIRIKINSYPYTEIINEHDQHIDYTFASYGGILSLNTCNGFTRLHDGTKLDSIENRFFIFDSSKPHNSTTTSDAKRRVNINFNWI